MKWTKFIANILILGSVIVGVYSAVEYSYYRMIPTSWVIDYHYIKPTKLAFKTTEDLSFEKSYEIKKEGQVTSIHQLKCNVIGDDQQKFTLYSTQINQIGEQTEEDTKENFFYTENSPMPPRTCFLESDVYIELPYGIRKNLKIIGDNFNII